MLILHKNMDMMFKVNVKYLTSKTNRNVERVYLIIA